MEQINFQGGPVDCSRFVASHAGDVTPTSLGVPATVAHTFDAVGDRFNALFDRLWHAGGCHLLDGRQAVLVARLGVIVPIEDVSFLDAAAILGESS